VEFWLDMEPLIKSIAIARKESSVKLLIVRRHLQTGYSRKVEEWIREYGVQDITTWVDFIPHEEVPRYVASIDVGITPFKVSNPTAFYAAPNKMWEYLSQGVVVASTPIPEALAYRNLVTITRSVEDYVNTMKNVEVLRESLKRLKPEVKKLINTRTWSRSAEKMRNILRKVVKALKQVQ